MVILRFLVVALMISGQQTRSQSIPDALRQHAFQYLLKGEKAQKKVWQDSFLLIAKKKIKADTIALLADFYQKKFETHLQKKLTVKLNRLWGGKPLTGIRIALDPGHFAGDFATARIEGKYIQMTLTDSTQVLFFESHLAWATAKMLQNKLEQQGAKVMLTRSQAQYTAFEKTFQEHYQAYLKDFKEKNQKIRTKRKPQALSESQFFQKIFRKQELQERVRKINAFAPDMTLIVHYNVDEHNAPWKKPINQNFSMAFVAGAFEWQDLSEEDTEDFLRLLTSQDLRLSVQLSEKILEKHQKIAEISQVPVENSQTFLKEKCLFTGKKGVYARNLLLSRAVKGIVCYGESLLQDSQQEVKRLNEKTLQVGEVWVSPRLQDITEAYFAGIMDFWIGK
jgi:N-acetylmuramoyl-L-alanine amidase